jgi:hypothetical protein
MTMAKVAVVVGSVLILLWLLGVVSGYTLGNFIYVLLIIGIILLLYVRRLTREAGSLSQTSTTMPRSADVVEEVPQPARSPSSSPSASDRAGKVFLSYRRDDSADVAGRMYDRLVQRFGKEQVFKDVDSIRLGVDFRRHLQQAVGECDILLAVVGDRWSVSGGAEGQKRLDDPKDYVRIELEAALARDIPIIPVLVRGANFPAEGELPASLQSLVYRNGMSVRTDPDFHRDMDRLIEGLERLLSKTT